MIGTRRWFEWIASPSTPESLLPPQPLPEIARDKVALGNHAKRLLDDEVLRLAFQRVEEDIIANWRRSKRADTEARETLYHMQAALQDVRAQLQSFLGNVQLLDAERKRREANQ